jgi:predicted kinase
MNRQPEARFLRRKRLVPRPCLVLMMGVAGSGKTTLAKEILRRLWAVYLDNNHVVDAFFPDTRSGRRYEKLRPHFYQVLYTIAEANLRLGNSILLDVPHIKEVQIPKWRRFINRLSARTKSKIVVIRCFCSERVLYSRIRSRGENRDRWKLAHWKDFLTEQPIKLPPPFPHLDIDTEKHLAVNTRAAVRYIVEQSSA